MKQKPKDFEEFLQLLAQEGYEVKRGKNTALRGKGQTRFIRFRSLGEGYTEEEIRAVLLGEKAHRSKFKSSQVHGKPKFNLLVDIDEKMQAKGIGYQRWATVYNLKQMAQTMIFIREHGIESLADLQQKTDAASARFDELSDRLKASEKRLVEKKATYAEYRAAWSEMQEYQKARHNVEVFFEMQQKEEEQERREQQAQDR